MDKVKKIFNSFILTFVLVGAFVCGITFYGLGNKITGKTRAAFADTNYENIVNNLPTYFSPKVDANSTVGNDGNSLFLLSSGGSIQTQMTNGIVDGEEKRYADGSNYLERNWAYYPDKENDKNTFYYFNFENTLSLYYNKTNLDIDEGNTDTLENLLDDQPLSRFANPYYGTETSYDKITGVDDNGNPIFTSTPIHHAEGFPISGYDFVPKNFKIDFKLDTTKENIDFGSNTESDNANKHVVILNKEGCYTLIVPYTYYLTNDGGKTFTERTTSTIKFTFMVFDYSTYLNTATKLPNVDTTLLSESSLINNAVYSRYYFYNYSSTDLDTTDPENPKAKLPTYTYDPRLYELTINHIDIDDGVHTTTIKLETNSEGEYVLVPRDSNGNVVACPVEYRLYNDQATNSLKCILSFNTLGTYNISFDFIYKNQEKTYNLPLSTLDQRVYMFGYQALYTSQDRDELTHQTISKELKHVNPDSTFESSADITSISGSTEPQNATSWTTEETDNIKKQIANKILKTAENPIKPISTNQTPIKLRKNNNVELQTGVSKIYKVSVDENGYATKIGNETGLDEAEKNYTGDNLKDAGTYLIITVYKFKDYLSSTGTQLSSNYHYQIFYLTITDTTPTVTITDTNGKTLYTDGYTNQSVVIVDNSASAEYDAQVELSIEARNYNVSGKVNHFNTTNFKNFTKDQYEQSGIVYTTDLSEYAGEQYSGKTGLFVNNTGIYHNGEFTVYIKSANSSTPSSRKFIIDTNEIGKISAQNVSFLSNTNYEIKGTLDGNITNQPLIFSWEEKNSGVPTYGYFKYFELKDTNYFDSSSNDVYTNSTLLRDILEKNNISPVNAVLDLSKDAGWSRYSNTNSYKDSRDIPASFVRSSAGLYIFEVFDDAGNYAFEVFLIDNTSPTFVKKLYAKDTGIYDLYVMTGSETITVNDAYENIILWGDKKGIYISGFDIPYNIENAPSHLYNHYSNDGILELNTNNTPIKEAINKFLNQYTNKVDNITLNPTNPSDLIPSYNGRYLTIDINDLSYIKEIQGDYHRHYGYTDEESGEFIANAYKINFFKENGEPFEGSYKFLLRDEANTKGAHTEITYKNSPSAFLTVNVSADSSKLEFILNNNENSPLSPSGYDLTGKFYNSKDEKENDILVKNNLNNNLTSSNLSYKYTYYSPIKSNLTLDLSYIPYAEDGSMLQSLSLTYYEYEKKSKVVSMNGHAGANDTYKAQVYYYGFKEMPSRNITIFELTEQNQGFLNKGQKEKFSISFGTTNGNPAPGKYIITRVYASDTSSNNQYDYYERNLVLIIDDKNIISSLEEISNDKLNSSDGYEYTNSLESIVGGDITIAMYAEEGNFGKSSISISFPGYNPSTGLNEGSLYTTSNMTEGSTPTLALTSNKVPLSVKVPKYKYTINNQYNYANNSYSVEINNGNSYYGDLDIVKRTLDNAELYDVYTNLVYKEIKDENNRVVGYEIDRENSLLLETFDRENDAKDYIASRMADDFGPSISEYELYAKIAYYSPNANEPSGYDRTPSAWYRTNKAHQDNYLKFFVATSEEGDMPENAEEIKEFRNPGRYVVTMYQASNQTSMEGDAYFGSLYKFAFVIAAPTPDFQVLTTNGNELDSVTLQNEIRYYTNEKNLRVRWTDDESEFMAKIDQNEIYITPYNGNTPLRKEKIAVNLIQSQEGSTTYWFDYNLSSIWNNGNKIAIQMQYKGLEDSVITKYVFIDYSAPLDTLEKLLDTTTTSTNNTFNRLFQERNMRSLYTSEGALIDAYRWSLNNMNEELAKVSYSYSNGSGNFRYFSYTINGNFFDSLYESIKNNSLLPEKTQNVYFKPIDKSISGGISTNYTQVTKESFSKFDNTYTNLKEYKENDRNLNLTDDTYYEVVELDTAGNMVVYIVYYNTKLDNEIALSYTNKTLQQNEEGEKEKSIENTQIQEGFNIYSNSGFQLTTLNYNKDAWGFFTTTIYGTTRYFMRSPWLASSNLVYEIGGSGTSMTFTPIDISEIFGDVSSGQLKHSISFSNRTLGTSYNIYVSVMDARLTINKRSTSQTATLQIAVPSFEQMQSTTRAYVTPRKITISRFETNGEWNSETLDGAVVESGNPQDWLAYNRDFLAFNYTGTYLEITITVQNNSSTKFKYEIEDNFGYTETIVQLINEETCQEVVGDNPIYTNIEGDSSTTYLSSGNLTYQYNSLLYTAKVVRVVGGLGQENTNSSSKPGTKNIRTITLSSQGQLNYDKVYVIEVYDSESQDNKAIKTINLRIYNRLPVLSDKKGGEANQNSVWFLDKNNQSIQPENGNGTIETIPSLSVRFRDKQFTSPATSITTFSNNVTIGFNDGQNMTNLNDLTQYPYSVYISSDRENWTNINEFASGYIVSGTGSYFLLAVYDSESTFTTECKLFMINILNSSSISYYFHVDGLPVEPRANFKYTAPSGEEFSTVYVLSVNYEDKDARVVIEPNKELNTQITYNLVDDTSTARGGVRVEIYTYSSKISKEAKFAVVYIGESSQILTRLSYENATGSSVDLLQSNDPANPSPIVALADETGFDKLKISWNNYYGIQENDINVIVQKNFNGRLEEINTTIYKDGNTNYIYLTRAGTYRLTFQDSCENPNTQLFGRYEFINITFLNGVPFTMTYTDPITNEEVVSEPINRAIYNGSVKLSLTDPTEYFASGYPIIKVMKDGQEYTNYTTQGVNNYIFNENGYYSVSFEAVSVNQEEVRRENFVFSIINANESRYTFEFSTYANYYIKSIFKDGRDVTQKFISTIDDAKVTFDNINYFFTNLQISYLDEKTGSGRYVITIETGEQPYKNIATSPTSFTFAFRINLAAPPIAVDLEEGGSTTNPIKVTYNLRNMYETVGDCIIRIPGQSPIIVNADTLAQGQETITTDITVVGTHYVQVYTMSGNLLFSYKVTRNEPLNVWAIIAIVIGVILVGVIIFITIKLRKRLKVK